MLTGFGQGKTRNSRPNSQGRTIHSFDQDPQREAPGMVCPVPEAIFQHCPLHRQNMGNTGWS